MHLVALNRTCLKNFAVAQRPLSRVLASRQPVRLIGARREKRGKSSPMRTRRSWRRGRELGEKWRFFPKRDKGPKWAQCAAKTGQTGRLGREGATVTTADVVAGCGPSKAAGPFPSVRSKANELANPGLYGKNGMCGRFEAGSQCRSKQGDGGCCGVGAKRTEGRSRAAPWQRRPSSAADPSGESCQIELTLDNLDGILFSFEPTTSRQEQFPNCLL